MLYGRDFTLSDRRETEEKPRHHLPQPANTPPMWADQPNQRRRRKHHPHIRVK